MFCNALKDISVTMVSMLLLATVLSLAHLTFAEATNLVTNPSFEEDLRGTWDQNGFTMTRYAEDKVHGQYSVRCADRDSDLEGPQQDINGMAMGKGYEFRADVKLLNDIPDKVWQSLKVVLKFSFTVELNGTTILPRISGSTTTPTRPKSCSGLTGDERKKCQQELKEWKLKMKRLKQERKKNRQKQKQKEQESERQQKKDRKKEKRDKKKERNPKQGKNDRTAKREERMRRRQERKERKRLGAKSSGADYGGKVRAIRDLKDGRFHQKMDSAVKMATIDRRQDSSKEERKGKKNKGGKGEKGKKNNGGKSQKKKKPNTGSKHFPL